MRLTLFDLDHTLLDGDSDQLWCEFLVARGVLPREPFASENAAMARDYALGLVSAQEFCDFYVGTLAGRRASEWAVLRDEWFRGEVAPRFPRPARRLVAQHLDAGDRVVLSTATNRFLSQPSATYLGIGELIATECEVGGDGRFTGRTLGTPNMREGKVQRLGEWLQAQRVALAEIESTMYSDSINDLPLLEAVGRAVAVNPDERLAAIARERGWAVISLR